MLERKLHPPFLNRSLGGPTNWSNVVATTPCEDFLPNPSREPTFVEKLTWRFVHFVEQREFSTILTTPQFEAVRRPNPILHEQPSKKKYIWEESKSSKLKR
jgi:hypothetical protein